MKNEKCLVDGIERYLNDVLIELPYEKESFKFEYEGKIFTAYPDNAKEFCMDYSQDNYSQEVSAINDSLEGLLKFIYRTADVVREERE